MHTINDARREVRECISEGYGLAYLRIFLDDLARGKAITWDRKGKVTPEKEWIEKICDAAGITKMAVFMKDSLIPIVREENMRRELPWEKGTG